MGLNFIKESITIGADKITDKTFTFFKQGFRLNGAIGEPEYRDVTVSGVDVLNLPNAKADGLNYCKLYGKCKQRDLPEGYTEVEYLQSSGTQYIDTGIVLDATMTVRVKYDFIVKGFVFGSRARASSTSSSYSGITNEDSGVYNIRYGNKVLYTRNSVPTGTVDVVISPDGVILNDVVVSTTSYGTDFYNGNCCLFTINNNGQAFVGEYAVNCIRRFAIDNVINLIPCRRNSDSVLGMYDTITGNFLTNAGTGTFIAGNDVVPTPTRPLNIICNNGVIKVSPNILDINNTPVYSGFISTDVGEAVTWTSSNISSTFMTTIKVSVGEYYTFSYYNPTTATGRVSVCVIENNIVKQKTRFDLIANRKNVLTIPITENGYLYLQYLNSATDIQLEFGSTATAYMPYGRVYTDGTVETVQDSLNNTATAEMLLAVNDYKDIQEVLTGNVTRNVGIKVLNGTEDWVYESEYSRFSIRLIPLSIVQTVARSIPAYCSHFEMLSNSEPITDVTLGQGYIVRSQSQSRVYFHSDITTIANFKQYLSDQYSNGTPVIILYPLQTATTSTVTAQTLTTKKGTNTIEITQASLTGLPIEVNYMAGVSVTVQQIEDSNLDNQVTVTIGD